MGKSYLHDNPENSSGDILVPGGPVLFPAAVDSDIPTPGSGAVLSVDSAATSTLNIKSLTGTTKVAPTGVTFPASAATVTVSQPAATADASGGALTISAQTGGTKSKSDTNGGDLVLASGAAGSGSSGTGGAVLVKVGATQVFKADATGLAFGAGTTVAKPSVTGSRDSNEALASLLTALEDLGLITDSSTSGAG